MNCKHGWSFRDTLVITRATGNCDNCGSVHELYMVPAMYIGDNSVGHILQIVPFGCPGCHKNVDTYTIPCGDTLNVTQEYEAVTVNNDLHQNS
jgi:hypothetical protein